MSKDFSKYFDHALRISGEILANRTPALRESRFEEAFQLYQRAATCASNQQERKRVHENILNLLIDNIYFYCKNPDYCVNFWDTASDLAGKISYWCGFLLFKSGVCSNFSDIHKQKNHIMAELDRVLENSGVDSLKFNCIFLKAFTMGADKNCFYYKAYHAFQWADYLFKKGVEFLQCDNKDVTAAKNMLTEMKTPLEECSSVIARSERVDNLSEEEKTEMRKLRTELKIKEDEHLMELRRSEALLLLDNADNNHQVLIKETEVPTVEDFLIVYDLYQQILLLVRFLDIELEAIIYSRMGIYQLKVLKFNNGHEKAREYFRKTLELAESLKPRVVVNELWYREAENHLRDLQKQQLKMELLDNQDKRKQYAKELSDLKKFLDDNVGSGNNLKEEMANILSRYNPRKAFDEKIFADSMQKKALYMTLKAYHPDQNQQEDDLWRLTCEDITAYLNRMLEVAKESE